MPRDIPVGNGELLVTFDDDYRIRDIYYPRVGMPNHTDGHVQRFGIWADGKMRWIDDKSWKRELRYKPDTMITEVRLVNDELGLEVQCQDAVDYADTIFFRHIIVTDRLRSRARDIRIFFHHDISVNGSPVGDTVNYDPNTAGLVHYKDNVYFLFNGCDGRKVGVDHWACGTKRVGGAEGTWRDAEDGQLSRNAIAQGSVDSTIGFGLLLEAGGTGAVTYWMAVGGDYADVKMKNRKIAEKTAQRMMHRTEAYWRLWACKEPIDFSPMPEPIRDLFVRSQLILRTQIDNGGAIMAANDSDITQFAGDTYSYMWPRDGALVAHALILAGHGELSRSFFRFCGDVIEPEGFFLHKYNPSGTLASSWHPWTMDGKEVLPIQQDETALVLWALRQHFLVFRDVEFIKSLYRTLIVRPAHWMLEHRDHNGLPLPTWDLWEERHGIHTWTVAATVGALDAAADFARDMGALDESARFKEGAERMRGAMMRHLWIDDLQRFARRATPLDDGTYRLDTTIDAANAGIFMFGALPANHPAVMAQMQAIRDRLWVKTHVGGVARYEHDYYHQIEMDNIKDVPGNPWIICTLWLAMHKIASAHLLTDLESALEELEWVRRRAHESGVLAEQYNPHTAAPVSVSPLTWSHATVLTTTMQYLLKHAELTGRSSGAVAGLARPMAELD
ncbi:MAG: glycoside hydrolase family 15 protein [Phycisphaerales bacterium]|nr:glycoside hydrolase family 15 protein [Phycisphaerales bacterium]